jgi:hypothetical protein
MTLANILLALLLLKTLLEKKSELIFTFPVIMGADPGMDFTMF